MRKSAACVSSALFTGLRLVYYMMVYEIIKICFIDRITNNFTPYTNFLKALYNYHLLRFCPVARFQKFSAAQRLWQCFNLSLVRFVILPEMLTAATTCPV